MINILQILNYVSMYLTHKYNINIIQSILNIIIKNRILHKMHVAILNIIYTFNRYKCH